MVERMQSRAQWQLWCTQGQEQSCWKVRSLPGRLQIIVNRNGCVITSDRGSAHESWTHDGLAKHSDGPRCSNGEVVSANERHNERLAGRRRLAFCGTIEAERGRQDASFTTRAEAGHSTGQGNWDAFSGLKMRTLGVASANGETGQRPPQLALLVHLRHSAPWDSFVAQSLLPPILQPPGLCSA